MEFDSQNCILPIIFRTNSIRFYISVYDECLDKVDRHVEEYMKARKETELPDIPARVGLQLMGCKTEKQPIRKVVEYFNFDFEYGKRPELTSFFQLSEGGDEFFVSDQRGFWSMFEDIYQPLTDRILLGITVTEIKYSDTSFEVTTSNGDKVIADYALCTFSTGVRHSDF